MLLMLKICDLNYYLRGAITLLYLTTWLTDILKYWCLYLMSNNYANFFNLLDLPDYFKIDAGI